ncbi:MAG: BatA domain-containing protein [Gemmatimonadota bacterium]
MGVVTPLFLLLGAAAAVPLVLHLLQRHQGPRLVFPALRYLRRAERESARRVRLRQLLLLLLRMAVVLLLAAAAARPFLRAAGDAHEPTALVIVLDNSMSTGAVHGEQRVLDVLKERALETVARVAPGDRLWLLRAGAPWEPALTADAATLADAIRQTEATAAAADLGAALERAATLVAAGAEGRAPEIHLLSDLQATALPRALAATAAVPVVVWLPVDDPPPNAWVSATIIGGGLPPLAGRRSTATVEVAGDRAGDSVAVRLALDGAIVAAGTAAPGAAAVLPFPARPAGTLTGHAEIDPDALRADDRRHFALRVEPPPTVALTGQAPFVEEALQVLEEAGRLRRVGSVAAADVALHAGGEGLAAGRALAIVLPPASAVALPALERRLAAAGVAWRYDPPEGGGEAAFAPAEGSPDELAATLAEARVRTAYGLRAPAAPTAGDSVLVALADGRPWAVRTTRTGGGPTLLLASPLDEAATTLPTSAAMLPLLDRLLAARRVAAPVAAVAPGVEVPLPAAADAVLLPDGTREAVGGGTRWGGAVAPGAYRILAGDSVLGAVAVNPDPAESELARLDRDGLAAGLPGWELHTTSSAGGWRRAVFQRRLGSELWRWALAAVLVLLVVESLVAASAGGARRHQGGSGGEPAPTAQPAAADA